MDLDSKVSTIGAGRVMAGKASGRISSKSREPVSIATELQAASRAQGLERAQTEERARPAILVATDGSEVSLRAGEYAVWLAGGLAAKLFVLYVVDENLTFHSGIHYGEFVEMLSHDGRTATGRVRVLAEKAGVECEELVVVGSPGRTIVAAAAQVGADSIVLGAEGMSRLEHALIGSVSEEVLRHANRTVLVVGGHLEGEKPGLDGESDAGTGVTEG